MSQVPESRWSNGGTGALESVKKLAERLSLRSSGTDADDPRGLDARISTVKGGTRARGRTGSFTERLSMFSSGLAEALMALQVQRADLVNQGMSSANFLVGVINLAAFCYVLGKWPQHFWIFFAFQSLAMIVMRTKTWFAAKLQLYLLDYCWVTAYVLCGVTLYTFVVRMLFAGTVPVTPEGATFSRAAFLISFTTASGPLSGAIAVTGNSLVFHSFEHFANMFIHAGPMLAAWALRWHGEAVEAAWPGLIGGVGASPTDSGGFLGLFKSAAVEDDLWLDLLLPTTAYYFAWWLPYSLWLLTDGVGRPAKGYDTVFNCFGPLLQAQLGLSSLRAVAAIYMGLHAVVCFLAHAIATYLFYRNYVAHTAFVCLMLLAATNGGAKLYNYHMLDAADEKVRELTERKTAEKAAKAKELV